MRGPQRFVGGAVHVGEERRAPRRGPRRAARRTPSRRARRPRGRSRRSARVRDSSRREVVRRDASVTAAAASSPSSHLLGRPRRHRWAGRPSWGRGQAFPGGAPSGCASGSAGPSAFGRPKCRCQSSVTTSSAVRPHPSRTRMPTRQRQQRGVEGHAPASSASRPRSAGQLAGDQREVDRAAHRRSGAHVGVLPAVAGPSRPRSAARSPSDLSGIRGASRRRCVARRRDPGSPSPGDSTGRRRPRRCGRCRRRRRGSSPPPAGSPVRAPIRPSRGTCSSPSLITVISTFSVSSGTRLISSMYSSDAVAQRRRQGAVDEDIGGVAVGQHRGGVEGADQSGRGQLGVALDELEARAARRRRWLAAPWTCRFPAAPPAAGGVRPPAPRRSTPARAAAPRPRVVEAVAAGPRRRRRGALDAHRDQPGDPVSRTR